MSSSVRVASRAIQIGLSQRGADLLPQSHQERVVQRGERVARLTHQYQRPDGGLLAEQREDGGVGIGARARAAPGVAHLRPAGGEGASEHRDPLGVRLRPTGADTGPTHEARPTLLHQEQGGAADRRQGKRTREQGVQHVFLPARPLEIA